MSPNLATIIQRAKRTGTYSHRPAKRNLVITRHATDSEHTTKFLAKAAANSYFGNNLGANLYSKKGY